MKNMVIIGGVVVILAAVAVYGLLTGWVRVGTDNNATTVESSVCSSMIGTWNDLMGDDATSRTAEDLANKITEVESRPDYQRDPTCSHMLFKAYLNTAETESAEAALQRLKEQTVKGQNPSIELVDITSVAEMERELRSLREHQEGSQEVDEDGLTNAG